MVALPRPDVTPGPHRELVDALHDLHHRAGWPSLRTLAKETGVSHTTVSKVFSAPTVPSWGTLELLVKAMAGDPREIHDLWLAASTPTKGEAPTPTRIAGRRAELTAVRRHLDNGAGLLLVTGEAGIGKTTLVEAAASSSPAAVVTGRCFPLSAGTPFMPLVDVLRALHALDGGKLLTAALDASAAYVTDEISRLLPEIGAPNVADVPSEWARQRLVGAFQSLLAAWPASEPLGIVLEDLHWADAATLDLLEHIATGLGTVPTIATWRLDDPGTQTINVDWLSRIRRSSATTEVGLRPLSRAETAHQLALVAPTMDADEVYTRSRGHPLFTAHLAADDTGSELPAVLADLLDARLGDLDGRVWRVARALGVADRPLDLDVLCTAAGIDREAAIEDLGALARRRLIERHSFRTVSLGHPLLAEAVRRRLVPGEGPDQHRALAVAMAHGPDPEPAEVATHWMMTGDVVEEALWRVTAAHSAAHRYDRAQEAEHWLRVLEMWPALQARPEPPPVPHEMAYFAAMDALQASLQFERAAALSDAAWSVLDITDDAVRAEVVRRAAVYRSQREGADVGRALLDEALVLYSRLPVCEGLVLANDWKQNLLRSEGDFEGAYLTTQAAVKAAVTVGNPSLTRRTMTRLAWHEGVRGSVEDARRVLDESDRQVPQGADPMGDIRRAVIETDVLMICGAPADEVVAASQAGLAVAQELGIEVYDVLLIRLNTSWALLTEGRLAEAARLIPEQVTEPVDLDRWPVYLLRAVLDGLGGDVVGSAERVDRLWQEMARNWARDIDLMVMAETVNAWRPAAERDPDRLLAALEFLVGSAPPKLVAPGVVAAARAAADASVAGVDVRALLERSHAVHQRSGMARAAREEGEDVFLVAHEAAWHAEVARLTSTAAVRHWVEAANHWDHLTRPHDAAYCRWRAAQVALREGQGTVAARLLKRAGADAREHVPLSEAIARTATAAR